MAHSLNIPLAELPLIVPELAFVAFPTALSFMPVSNVWAVIFYLMMILLGIDSQFPVQECIWRVIEDEENFYLGY